MIATSSAAIYQSPDYPSYPKTNSNCMKNITTTTGHSLKVYLNSAIFTGTNTKYLFLNIFMEFNVEKIILLLFSSCANAKDYVKIYDGFQSFVFCGSPNFPRLLFQTRSNWVVVELNTTASPATALIKGGFQIFIESTKIYFI